MKAQWIWHEGGAVCRSPRGWYFHVRQGDSDQVKCYGYYRCADAAMRRMDRLIRTGRIERPHRAEPESPAAVAEPMAVEHVLTPEILTPAPKPVRDLMEMTRLLRAFFVLALCCTAFAQPPIPVMEIYENCR